MIAAEDFCSTLYKRGYDFFAGVPCSYLKDAFAVLERHERYVAAPNEGVAISAAAGAELAGRRTAVLLQNSGTGNLLDPLTSLLMTYRIPTVLFVSLRGWPRPEDDESHHGIMGAATAPVFDAVGLKPWLLEATGPGLRAALDAADEARATGQSFVILMPGGSIGPAPEQACGAPIRRPLNRADVVSALRPLLAESLVYTTTGLISRELFGQQDGPTNFYMQGSMGHAIGLGLGTAIADPHRRVTVVDGDGAALMHLGGMALAGEWAPPLLTHVVIDNSTYESTGGQSTRNRQVAWHDLARSLGYREAFLCGDQDELRDAIEVARSGPGPHLIGALVGAGGPKPPRVTSRFTNEQIAARFAAAVTDHQEGDTHGTANPGPGPETRNRRPDAGDRRSRR